MLKTFKNLVKIDYSGYFNEHQLQVIHEVIISECEVLGQIDATEFYKFNILQGAEKFALVRI